MRIPTAPTINNPVLFDALVVEMQGKLTTALSWLSHAFGASQTLVKSVGEQEYTLPGVYVGSKEYFSVLPNDQMGNYSFFKIDEQNDVEWIPNLKYKIKAGFSLIFFFKLTSIYPSDNARRIENVKNEVISALNGFHCKNGYFEITAISSDAKAIYEDYTIEEKDKQFMMHPYGALKFSGVMEVHLPC